MRRGTKFNNNDLDDDLTADTGDNVEGDEPDDDDPRTRLDQAFAKWLVARGVCYLRVTSVPHSAKALASLNEQRRVAAACMTTWGQTTIGEFVECERSGLADRPALLAALKQCKDEFGILVVPQAQGLLTSRRFLAAIRKANTSVWFCEGPRIAGRQDLKRHLEAVQRAEQRSRTISTATKEGMRAAKLSGKRLGRPRMVKPPAPVTARQRSALRLADRVAPIINDLRAGGCDTLQALAKALTRRRIKTSRGKHSWSPMQVSRVLDYLENGAKGKALSIYRRRGGYKRPAPKKRG